MAALPERTSSDSEPTWGAAAQAMVQAAHAVSRAGGSDLFAHLVHQLAALLRAAVAFVAVFTDESRSELRTLAAELDGKALRNFDYRLEGSPCAQVVGRVYRYVARGVAAEFGPDTIFAAKGIDSYAAFPLFDSRDAPLGLLVAMDREPIADPALAEALLKIFAARVVAEIEQLRAHEALRSSAASYRAIFEASEDCIFVHDWDSGAVLDVNPKACATYGYSRDELRRIALADISSGQVPYTVEQAMYYIGLAKRGESPVFEWHRRNRDGSLHWDEVRLKAAQIDGKPHVLAFTREITEHKAALAALHAREEQYRVIFDGSADAMIVWNGARRIADVNPAFSALSGYQRHEVLGMALRDFLGGSQSVAAAAAPELPRGFLDEESTARCELGIARALQGHTGQLEMRAVNRAGQPIDIEMRYMPINVGDQPHVLSVSRDVTERRERERALQRSEARLRATVLAAFDCVIGMDADGRIVEFNAAAERCFGHQREQVLGRLLADVILPERHRDAHTRGLKHFHAAGHGPMVGRLVETTAQRADGSEFPVELAISVATAPDGNIFVGHLRDISARRAAEAERAALEAQLRQAQKMEAIGQLTGGIAHDFNNILTAVIGYVVLGQERAAATADAKLARQLESAHLAAQRARDLIAQMLTFARRGSGDRRVVALPGLVRQSLQLLRSTLPSSLLLETAVGEADDTVSPVLADTVQFEQVLFNLCINARDAMHGSGTIRVALRQTGSLKHRCASCGATVGAGPWVALEITDSGPGIAPEVLERMFEPFFTTKEVGRGSGMGLAMVHGIVHNHGGHVLVDARPGDGARFRVLWPAATIGAAAALPASAAGVAAVPQLHGRVMVVEDEPAVADLMVELLDTWGLDVVLMRDPLEAQRWLDDATHALDLLITDHTMPRMTGMQLAQHMSATRPTLPVLLYTGCPDTQDTDVLRRHGVQALLRKPVDPQALRASLQRWLSPR
ncbi:MAG TPA: PAS domain S-box protein [Burkholderiaceae bacterium]|nr:PAS domain S-box protein [Burkholderiaceae bacterium]